MVKKYGRYEVIRRIGGGGQGVVFLAYDPLLRREVAIKVIAAYVSDEDLSRQLFEREAAVMASLNHPAIVPIYDFGEQDGYPYLVMPFMGGGSLRDRLNQKGPFSVQEVVELFERLAPALDMAHAQGMIHRDLKPGNILLNQQSYPSITDFGLVKLLDTTRLINSLPGAGTPQYMSPEQGGYKKEIKIDHRTDIYALGVILFELLTGKWPYESDNAVGFALLHITESIPNICQINPNLPAECQPIIERALAKQPDDRYDSVGELVEALKTLTETDLVAYMERGHALYNKREYDLAIAEYSKAIHKRPDYSNAYLSRGNAYYWKGEYGLAIADYDETLRLTPDYMAAYYWRGKAKQGRRQFEQAIGDYDVALGINPNYRAAYFQRGLAYEKTGRFDLAIADYDAMLRLNSNDIKAETQREVAYKLLLNNESRLKALPPAGRVNVYVNLFKNESLLGSLPLQRRAAIGIELGQLGDPRPEVITIEGMEFCWVPAGDFYMGCDNAGYDDNKPLHLVNIPYGYWIGRYPVTNAQYLVFVEDGGYGNPAFWTEAKAQGYWKDGKMKDRDDWRDRPYDYGTPYTLPNHPVVGVNWYEGLAFTRWLTESSGAPARLPTEGEWEKAARGGLQIPATPLIRPATNLSPLSSLPMTNNPLPQRHFPWGNGFDASLMNCKESGIGHPNAVGAFLMAKTPYGCEEMSGNVWEWCQSQRKTYDYHPDDGREKLNVYAERVLRGGSFSQEKIMEIVLFYRHGRLPSRRYNNRGFRVFRPYHI